MRLPSIPAHVSVVLASVLAGLVAAAVIGALVYWRGSSIPAHPTEPQSEDWTLSCWITGAGADEANEDFSGARLEEAGRVRGAASVEQQYPGTRVKVRVRVTRRAGLKRGRYVLYGTVTRVDLASQSVELTDCAFYPEAAETHSAAR